MSWEHLEQHLASGATTLARAWRISLPDGRELGFTDHDRDLEFAGAVFKAEGGLSGQAVAQALGLAVDNTEVLGALSGEVLDEADILAGRFDGAEVRCWLVNWAEPGRRVVLFRGTIGEIAREGAAFRAEFRGLSEALNLPQGRVYQRDCGAVLGDAACGVDLNRPEFRHEAAIGTVREARVLTFPGLWEEADRWFERGLLTVLSGDAAGLVAQIKSDRQDGRRRVIELWQELGAGLAAGDMVRLQAGCDKRADTCRAKFQNFMRFRGFPHIPGEDWLTTFPSVNGVNDGGGMNR